MGTTGSNNKLGPVGLFRKFFIMVSAGLTLLMCAPTGASGAQRSPGGAVKTAGPRSDSGPDSASPAAYQADRFTLSNGARVILVPDHTFPRITFGMALKTKCLATPPSKEGLAGLTFNLLTRGTMLRSRMEIVKTMDDLGGALDVTISPEAAILHGDVLSGNMQRYLDLVAEMVTEPRFDRGEFTKLRREIISEITSRLDDDASVAGIHHRRQLFSGHPYGRDLLGTMDSMKSITREDAIDWYSKQMTAPELIFYVSGDTTTEQLKEGLELAFGSLPHQSPANTGGASDGALLTPPPPLPPGKNLVIVDKPERTLSHILIGHPTINAGHPDRYALEVLMTALGGPIRSRMMEEVREKRGWSYGAYTNLWLDTQGGALSMWTFPSTDDTVETIELLHSMFSRLHQEGITQDEADGAMLFLLNSHPFKGATAEELAGTLAKNMILNLPDDAHQRYPEHLMAVTPADLKRVAAEHLTPDRLALTVLCTAAELKVRLSELSMLTGPPVVVKYNQ